MFSSSKDSLGCWHQNHDSSCAWSCKPNIKAVTVATVPTPHSHQVLAGIQTLSLQSLDEPCCTEIVKFFSHDVQTRCFQKTSCWAITGIERCARHDRSLFSKLKVSQQANKSFRLWCVFYWYRKYTVSSWLQNKCNQRGKSPEPGLWETDAKAAETELATDLMKPKTMSTNVQKITDTKLQASILGVLVNSKGESPQMPSSWKCPSSKSPGAYGGMLSRHPSRDCFDKNDNYQKQPICFRSGKLSFWNSRKGNHGQAVVKYRKGSNGISVKNSWSNYRTTGLGAQGCTNPRHLCLAMLQTSQAKNSKWNFSSQNCSKCQVLPNFQVCSSVKWSSQPGIMYYFPGPTHLLIVEFTDKSWSPHLKGWCSSFCCN